MLFRFCVFLHALFVCAGCRLTPADPAPPDYDYFPLQTGRYVIYDVQEQRYSLNAAPIQRTYQLKEVVGAAYPDVTGQTAYRLVRYRRPADGQPWQADSVWSARLVSNEAIRTENGRDLVKLVFPVGDGLTWDGNRHNAAGKDDYQMRNSGQPYRVGRMQFDQTVTVEAQNDSTLISLDRRVDVYARQVGLVYKEKTQFQFCTASPTCVGKHQIDYGIQQIYRIRDVGTE